ncbi:ATP-binding protein [Streptomyces sp. TRM68416]|uniref:ATP-binding protein n=1 Tax=Streptomyces sp. TRM68416 TaxID=2758412 RepID=UPI001661CB41|nr:ATP-binding protein [Streptomyces sp. TRM68416]MBD0840717.1 ATP-binding protein [Streptomyces sp. TRM68416]
MGAPESNAGDEFHFWWAASRALELLNPNSDLCRVSLEGLARVDDPDEKYETVDVAEYYGGSDVRDAHTLVMSQLKYSTRHPDQPWTASRLCERRSRRTENGPATAPRSVVADLADAYRRLRDDHGTEAVGKSRIALVSNCPGDPHLLASVKAAEEWVRAQDGEVQRAALLRELPGEQGAVIRQLSTAVGGRLSSSEFCRFLTVLDLSQTGMMDRATLARAVRAGASELTPGHGPDSALRLFDLVRRQALPEASRDGITVDDVLVTLGAPEVVDLYPAPSRLPDVPDPLPAPSARDLAETALEHLGEHVVAHGEAGAGKTTTLRQMGDHLPEGSALVLFDCYGGGDYLSSGEERHTPRRFVTQVVNELAQQCGTPLLIQPPQVEEDLWRWLNRTLERASGSLAPGAVLVVAVDAADNAVVAADERGDRGFLSGLVRLPLPERVVLVLTARSHRVPSLGADPAETVEISPFDAPTSALHLRRHRAAASDTEAGEFHTRTGGNPRSQFYALAQADANGLDVPALLEECERTPEPLFADLVSSALQVSGADAGGQRWLALMLALARPVSIATLAAALDVDMAAVSAFAGGLVPGVKVVDDLVQFRDEDFETYVRGRVSPSDVVAAHHRLADMFLASRAADPDAAAHVADHLFAADRLDELLQLVLDEDTPAGIADGFRREQVQGRRLDLAARAAARTGSAVAAVRVAARGCDTASRSDTLSRLVESHLDLVAQYVDVELLHAYALRQSHRTWLGPVQMRIAGALSRDPERHTEARAALDNAEAWLRRWKDGRNGESAHWTVDVDDVAAAAEARYRLDGVAGAVDELRRWRPTSFVHDVTAALAARLAGEISPDEARDVLRANSVPPAAQAPFLAHAVSSSTAPDPVWVDEVAQGLLAVAAPELQRWHLEVLDAVIRHGNGDTAAALARHWSPHELPAYRWSFTTESAEGVLALRCHAAAAVLAGTDLNVGELVPQSLRARQADGGRAVDPREHERVQWREVVDPLAGAVVLLARTAVGQAGSAEVSEFCEPVFAGHAERKRYRWFTFDRSYRPWATLVTKAVIDTNASPELLDRLADSALELIRDGSPELWLDMADVLSRHGGHEERAAALCMRAAEHARAQPYSASDRLELLARSSAIAATVAPSLGKHLFDQAVDAATGINDDAARLLSVHADLAQRATVEPARCAAVAARLIRVAEAVAPHVTDTNVIPYEAIVAAAARLDAATGMAAASRWDDEDRLPLAASLPGALTGAVSTGAVPAWQALCLDHLIDDDRRRLTYQIDVALHLTTTGAAGYASARTVLTRAASSLRRRAPARDQPALARQLFEAAAERGLEGTIRSVLDPVLAIESTSDSNESDAMPTSRRWYGDETTPETSALLADPASRGWRTLPEDVTALRSAHVYGDELNGFISTVVRHAPMDERVQVLEAVGALSGPDAATVMTVLADRLDGWRGWPGLAAWAESALPSLVARFLPDLAWHNDVDGIIRKFRAFGSDGMIRNAILLGLPQARTRLTAYGWQNIASLLGRLCEPASAAEALLGLLDDRISEEAPVVDPAPSTPLEPVPMLLWSAFGHPRRDIRWRAAYATRDLLTHPDVPAAAPLATQLVQCLDLSDTGPYRDRDLHFYRLSASAGLLVALRRIAAERPAILAPHRADLVRHATSSDLPHAQIRELARQAALDLASPGGLDTDVLGLANQPDRCYADRKRQNGHHDRRGSTDRRYDFDQMDTLPYWYSPLASVFDVPVDTISKVAEPWILDKWGLSQQDWWTDKRELRSERTAGRMSHRQGVIPREESLRLYLEYHAMMTAAGELADTGRPVRVGAWDSDEGDPWEEWIARHLPPAGPWLGDLGVPVPVEPELFGPLTFPDGDQTAPEPAAYDRVLRLVNGDLPDSALVASSVTQHRPEGREEIRVWSALVAPDHAGDLQRALASASDPHDWKLPAEGEERFEVGHGAFDLRGWLADPNDPRETLAEHDPYAHGMQAMLPLPGRRFRDAARATTGPHGFTLVTQDGATVARAEQWADPDYNSDERQATSRGYRVHVDRTALLNHLAHAGTNLIVEVQIGRYRSDAADSGYRAPRSRIYLVDAAGRVTAS